MSKQSYIYDQVTSCGVRNKAINNVNTSSDMCMFSEPLFYVSGATKVPYSIESCNLSGTDFDNQITKTFSDCFSTAMTLSSCFCGMTWSNEFYNNSDLIYSAEVLTSILTSNTLTQGVYVNSICTDLNNLGYAYSISGSSIINLSKPYGINNLELNLCLDITYNSACTTSACGKCLSACTFSYPYLTSASTGVYFFNQTGSTFGLSFIFTGNTTSFSSNTTFKYSIFKYDPNIGGFGTPAIYNSNEIEYSTISATSSVTITISSSTLNLDGDYLIKGYFIYDACTDILNRLGVKIDTSQFNNGNQYILYNEDTDYYFVAITSAATPTIIGGLTNTANGRLFGFSMFPVSNGQTGMTFTVNFIDDPIVALNGLVLAKNFDYVISGHSVTFISGLMTTDVITMIGSVGSSTYGIHNDLITITNPITSGVTGGEGNNSVYYNTTTGKYEVYTLLTPSNGNQIIITLNGVVLAPNIDYYQSISNSKRFILEGVVMVGDVINLYYLPTTNIVGNIYANTFGINWSISIVPQAVNGQFVVEVSTGNTFTTLLTSATTSYQIGVSNYNAIVTLSGTNGQTIYYRVKNIKDYRNITGDIIESIAYSETIPIIIASNALNSY